jgi:hypothetical protein
LRERGFTSAISAFDGVWAALITAGARRRLIGERGDPVVVVGVGAVLRGLLLALAAVVCRLAAAALRVRRRRVDRAREQRADQPDARQQHRTSGRRVHGPTETPAGGCHSSG